MIEEEIKKRKEIKKFIIIATPKNGNGHAISFSMFSSVYDIYDKAQKEVDKIMWDTWPHYLEIVEEAIADKVLKRKEIKVEIDVDNSPYHEPSVEGGP